MRRGWFVAAIVLGVVAIAVAAFAIRLQNDKDAGAPSATEWAGSVCTSLSDWKTSIAALADLDDGLDAQTLGTKIDDAQAATTTLVNDLEELGPPDLEAGDEARARLSASVDELRASFDELEEGAHEAADAGSATDFLRSLAKLAPQFQALLGEAATTIEAVESANVGDEAAAELRTAFESAPACDGLRNGDG